MTAALPPEPVLGAEVRHILWPVHRRGRIWSYAMVAVRSGIALVPLEVALARVVAGVGGFLIGFTLVWVLMEAGVLPADVAEGAGSLIVAGAIALLSERLARREALRRMARILADPEKYVARRRSFVVPAQAELEVQEKRRGLLATFSWTDPGGRAQRAALVLPSDNAHGFREIWQAARR